MVDGVSGLDQVDRRRRKKEMAFACPFVDSILPGLQID
jgi:hypothetical protein